MRPITAADVVEWQSWSALDSESTRAALFAGPAPWRGRAHAAAFLGDVADRQLGDQERYGMARWMYDRMGTCDVVDDAWEHLEVGWEGTP